MTIHDFYRAAHFVRVAADKRDEDAKALDLAADAEEPGSKAEEGLLSLVKVVQKEAADAMGLADMLEAEGEARNAADVRRAYPGLAPTRRARKDRS